MNLMKSRALLTISGYLSVSYFLLAAYCDKWVMEVYVYPTYTLTKSTGLMKICTVKHYTDATHALINNCTLISSSNIHYKGKE